MLKKDMSLLIRIIIFLLILIFGIKEVNAEINYNVLYNNESLVAKYEHGGKGYQAIAKDSYGGYSYGKWQISTKRYDEKLSTFDFFLKYTKQKSPTFYKQLEEAGGYKGAFFGEEDFINTWKTLAKNKEFQKIYDNFIIDTQIIPVYKRLDNSNDIKLMRIASWGSEDKVIHAILESLIIQHGSGGAYNMISKVIISDNPETKEMFLKSIYEYRKKKFPKYKRRYNLEYAELNQYLVEGKS